MLNGEATYINFIDFGLIQSGPEPTIYSTRAEHANPLHPRCGLYIDFNDCDACNTNQVELLTYDNRVDSELLIKLVFTAVTIDVHVFNI